jgi:glucose/arabinose dehydrogenase
MKVKFLLPTIFLFTAHLLNAQLVTLSLVSSAFTAPVDIKHAGDKRLFIVERGGTISLFDTSGVLQVLPFLNISSRVKSGSEQGLLGLAFDPEFKTNGFFYVDYTRQTDGSTRISRFHLTGNPNHCDSTTEQILLTIYQPFTNHNGGNLTFGPDGYLYIGMGDGGSGGDPGNRAQNLDSLLGKILRIDVHDSSVAYKIPPDNPFVGKAGRDEIWDYGVRNPWRFSFDHQTNELWIADVGQNKYEEIDLEPAASGGINYGWRCYEGDSVYNTSGCGPSSDYTFPIYAYDHSSSNCSVTGGYRYRGTQFPAFTGKYFFADYCAHTIRYLSETSPGVYINTFTTASLPDIVTFGEDVNRELYVATIAGHAVYRICDGSCTTNARETSITGGITIYPNPNEAVFTISFTNKIAQHIDISVSNILGQTIFEEGNNFDKGKHQIPVELNQKSAGVYFLHLKTTEGMTTKMFVVK